MFGGDDHGFASGLEWLRGIRSSRLETGTPVTHKPPFGSMRQTQPAEAGWRGMRRLLNIRWQAFILSRDSGGECFSSLRAVAKQSSAQCKPPLDCFVASAPRNDERSVLATRFAPEAFFTLQDKVPQTKAREAERRMAHPVPIATPER